MSGSAYRIDSLIADWEQGGQDCELAVRATQEATGGRTGPFPGWLHPQTLGALAAMGITAPFIHQNRAWECTAAGRNAVVATPTASGKTLCYNVPVADAITASPGTTALYLFPTKALARDQEAGIRKLLALAGLDAKAAVYDGDTAAGARRAIRQQAAIVITNPDMLHTGILPHHTDWARFFAGLRFIVVDELHHYRGVFGSHVANVLRRLQRIAAFYGARPLSIACSATIGNPGELAARVLGGPVDVIDDSGAPTGRRDFLLLNPPVVDPVMGVRRSAMKAAARIAADLVARGITTLVFCQTRRGVEIVLHYVKDKVASRGGNPDRIRGYRGGYLPELRREIEGLLREGALDAVVATNALELGIDVGGLDAVVLAGYPGTIAATRQRSGRAGRRQEPSITVLIARNTPIDQFLARHPSFLLESSPEQALVHPDNVDILLAHLRCAVFELPFATGERFSDLSADDTAASLDFLAGQGVAKGRNGYHFVGSSYPASEVSLRNAAGDEVVVFNSDTQEPVAKVPPHSARFELHEGAIYQHDGETYEVTRFDVEQNRAFIRPVEPVYYTVAVDQTNVEILSTRCEQAAPMARREQGDVQVVEHMVGFKKVKFRSHENLGFGEIRLPPLTLETEGTWMDIDAAVAASLSPEELSFALEGLSHALAQVASLRLMCDPNDIATAVQMDRDEEDRPPRARIVLYDAHAGGVGLSTRAFEEMDLLLADCLSLLRGCPCASGCPACTGPLADIGVNGKSAAVALAALLNGALLRPQGEVRH